MIENFTTSHKIVAALAYASGTADREGAGQSMVGYETITAIVHFAAINNSAVTAIKMQQSDDDGNSDAYSDLEGTKIDVAGSDDDQIFYIEVVQPQKKYVRLYEDKDASNAVAESAIYILSGPRERPVTNNVTDLVTGELHVSPDEGTA